ncbi:Hypp1380 [Branchiostoma lanceolatum]|uniref:Hypp1380 protein n=1 Tax=Branchiostoma lanceolatum TaxID=7740 RepID=A0A8J9ZH82_BRALA|nr:Hypp1380 [Branchiostoma lanceolatum]
MDKESCGLLKNGVQSSQPAGNETHIIDDQPTTNSHPGIETNIIEDQPTADFGREGNRKPAVFAQVTRIKLTRRPVKISSCTDVLFSQKSTMLRVCEKLREVDPKGRRYGLARAETGYLRALVDAMADMDRLAEVELLKSLGDVNVEKGRLGKAEGEFNRALALYMAAVVRCDHREQGEGLEHRYEYTEKLLQRVSSKGSNGKDQPTEDKETTTPAKVAGMFQDLDNKWATGGNTDSVLVGYAQLMVEGIVDENNMLETEAIKSLGDVYLKRGTIIRNMTCLTRASALYNTALARCNNVQGTRVIAHRLLHTAKIRQDITTTEAKRSTPQRQEDVRGRKDHPPPFSAAPSSDVINDGIFYRRYFKEADLELGNGDLDAAEQSLEAALKLIHDPSKPDKAKEADCLCRLGDVYVERGKRTGEGRTFTQAAALYNASMARTYGDKQRMITRLRETERQFLRNTCKIDCELCPNSITLNHIQELGNMRARVKSQLETIHQEHNPYQYDEDDPVVREVEIQRAEAVKNLFKSITVERQEFIQLLTAECIDKLGAPPCKYAFIGLGSQATELVTPYSDLEFAILIEEGKDNEDTRGYFLNLTHYLHLKVINLGETILPAMAISALNDFLSEDPEKNWFFDSVTPRGFAFDGFMPWASKTPFGRDDTKIKPAVSLIQTPAELAEYQHQHIAIAEGYHLSDILRRVSYLTGDESLVEDYTDRVNKSVNCSPGLSRRSAMLTLKEDIREIKYVELTGQLLDVKKEIYRFPSVAVDVLSVCCGIAIPSVWTMIEEFLKTQWISEEDAHHLTVLISISAELRLRAYIANGGQKDRLSPLIEMKLELDKHDVDDTFFESVFYIPDSKMLFRYYYTAIPLKRCIVDAVLKTSHERKIFQTAIFDTSSQTRGLMKQQLFHLDTSIRYLEAALEEVDMDKEKQLEILFELGNTLRKHGDCKKALDYYTQAFQVGKTIHDIMYKQQSFNWRELADKGACVPNSMYVSRADVTYDAVAADKMTKCCNLRKKMLQAAGLVIVIVIFFLLPYFAVKVATISADVAKLSEELAILSDTMAKLNSMAQLRFARLEREIVS